MGVDVKALLEENKAKKSDRSNWDDLYQTLGETISQVKQDFQGEHTEGEFLQGEIFDSTGTFAAHNSASALIGLLWPSNAKKSVAIDPPEDMENVTAEEQTWFDEVVTKRLTRQMDSKAANLILSLGEYMLDQQIFGTSGIGTFWEDGGLLYRSYGVKGVYIEEGKNGRVDTTYINVQWKLRRVVQEYGLDNLSEKLQKKFKDGKGSEKIKLLIVYQPRLEVIEGKEGNLNMPVESIHIEVDTNHLLRESGFAEFPIHMGRATKLSYETQGRSDGMNALPDILELGAIREAIIVATEKTLDPPLGVLNSGMLGGGVLDTSSGAVTVFDVQSNVGNTPPVFQINTIGDMRFAMDRIEELKSSIAQHFSLDRLLDFNNQVSMTATETRERAGIRNASLAAPLSRQVTEVFTPLVERSVNLMIRNNQFGFIAGTPELQAAEALGEDVIIIPDRIAQRLLSGLDVYSVRFKTPADRVTNEEELDGMIQIVGLSSQLAQIPADLTPELDRDKVFANGIRLFGAPPDVIRSAEEVAEIQAAQQQAQQQAQMLQAAEQAASIAKDAKQAELI